MAYPTSWARNDPSKFMCELCFHIFDISACAVVDGQKIDVCAPCIDREKAVMKHKESQD